MARSCRFRKMGNAGAEGVQNSQILLHFILPEILLSPGKEGHIFLRYLQGVVVHSAVLVPLLRAPRAQAVQNISGIRYCRPCTVRM
jgi:hypothetical protein